MAACLRCASEAFVGRLRRVVLQRSPGKSSEIEARGFGMFLHCCKHAQVTSGENDFSGFTVVVQPAQYIAKQHWQPLVHAQRVSASNIYAFNSRG